MLFYSRATLIALSGLLLNACSITQQTNGLDLQHSVQPQTIVKSPADSRDYRAITLDNGLKVMLVSDPTADRAAAALDVHVGSGDDPRDREGLAHYLEHMLFLGTEKYPESGEYQEFIAAHGGSHNAYTVINHTNYFFHITPDYFEGGLDRFAQFFIAPLFNPEYVQRERAVVYSEYKARKNDEGRRLWTARSEIFNPEHPITKFSIGSLSTLADRDNDLVRDDLIEFYNAHYHASRMALSVISSHSLDDLQKMVEEKFSAISDEGEPYTPFKAPLVTAEQLSKKLTLTPLKETRQLTFSFPIDSVYPYEASKPAAYLSNLLGHEGEGSLLAYLKAKTWVNSLSAGLGYSDDVQASFDVKMNLSEIGINHVEEIGKALFAAIETLRASGIKPLYFNESKQLAELDFRFQEKSEESSFVQRLASLLHRYEARDVLSAPYLYKEFSPEHIAHILTDLNPDNLQLIVVDPAHESEQKTDWYDVEFTISEIEDNWLRGWRQAEQISDISLPKPNPFIPDQLALLTNTDKNELPRKIKDTLNVEVWHQTLVDFKQPKAELYFTLRSPAANDTAEHALLTELYVKAVEEQLNAYSYPAYLAGLEYQIYKHSRGLSVRVSGYADKQATLLDKIVSVLESVKIDQPKFDLYLETVERGLDNELKARPSRRVIDIVYDVFLTSSWSTEEKLAALKSLSLDDLNTHITALLTEPQMMVLSVGNVSELDSLRAGDVVSRLITDDTKKTVVARAKIRRLTSEAWTVQPAITSHEDAAMALLFQGQSTDVKELAKTHLLGALIHTPYYQTLRTEAQVGYIVSAFAFNLLDTPALGFSVQSNSHSVEDIVARTTSFLSNYANTLKNMPNESFESTKVGLIARLSKEDKTLQDVASRYWSELDREAYSFDTREKLIQAVQDIDQTALSIYFTQLVSSDQSAVLLSYSFGDKSDKLTLPQGAKTKTYPSLSKARRTLTRFF